MKYKISHISLAFLLLISTFGITINKHFCGNRMISASIFLDANSCCKGNCGKCHNESHSIRVTDAYESAFSDEIVKNPYVSLQINYYKDLAYTFNIDNINQFVVDISPNISPHQIIKSATLLQNFRL
jgi:hypothetical protein